MRHLEPHNEEAKHNSTASDHSLHTANTLTMSTGASLTIDNKQNLCHLVRSSCHEWCKHHHVDVAVSVPKIDELARDISDNTSSQVVWDEEGWHYHPPWSSVVARERIALYILALDAINFCFWPNKNNNYEYEHLAMSLTKMAERDHREQEQQPTVLNSNFLFSAQSLRDMTEQTMKQLFSEFQPTNDNSNTSQLFLPPNLKQRCLCWNEVGRVLERDFHGSAWRLVQTAQNSAVRLVDLLWNHFPSFRDGVQEKNMFFLKRAQICVGDWEAALSLQFQDKEQLTTFADYRLPQLLRERGVFQYSPVLSCVVDAREELTPGSDQEVAIRAATVVAVDLLVDALNHRRKDDQKEWTAVSVDWYLWQLGERLDSEGKLSPHHRVRTIYY